MEFGPEDLVEFGRYYLASLLSSLVVCFAMLVVALLAARLRPGCRPLRVLGVCLVPLPLVCWIVYFMATSELTYTLVLLGSESSQVAERTYINRFKRQVNTLDAAVRLAISRHQEPNVRFYASCLVADKKGSVNENDSAEEPLWSKSDSEKDHLRCIPRQFKSRTDEASA